MDDRGLERFLRIEMARLHEQVFRSPRPLPDLLAEERPVAPTRAGEHLFERAALDRLADALSPLTRARLRVPVLFYAHGESRGSCYVSDEDAWRALAETGTVRSEPREGRLWLSEPLAREFARRFPTCAQFVTL